MELKPGYKQTEVGVIPEEWDVKPLGDLFSFSGGYSASRDQLSTEGHCYLHYGDIHGSTKTFVNTRVDYQDIPKLDIPLKRVSSRSLLKDGDVVFVDASEDDEGASKHVVVVNKESIPFISGLHTIVAKSKTDELVHEYRCYCFQTAAIREQFLFYAVGTKVVGISKSNIPKLFLPIPKRPEQRAIATALSDVDALLGGLDRLIAKKRDLKQAAMQQLLTGQTRLPGFHGEWKVKRLGDVGTFLKGRSVKKDEAKGGALPCIRYGEIYTHHNDYIRSFNSWISPEVAATATRLTQGDLLFAGSGETKEEIGKCVAFTDDCEAFAGGDIVILRLSGAHAMFMGYYCNTAPINAQKASKGQGDAVVHISAAALSSVVVTLPSLPEQTAIATVLTDMDAELSMLQAQRDKTRALKQAMMQGLLTGRTRLI
jgi:type I restriction enzyme S subunit